MKQSFKTRRHSIGRIICLTLAMMTIISVAEAKFLEKPEPVRPFEAELYFGAATGFKYHDTNSGVSGAFGLELRGNIKGTPWDVGGFLRLDATNYDFTGHFPPSLAESSNFDPDQSNSMFSIGAVSHYNFRQGRKVNPFVGLGLGVSFYSTDGHDFTHPYPTDGRAVSFIPKFGVELFSWVRFTGYGVIVRKGYNVIGLSVGLTIGGWRKK